MESETSEVQLHESSVKTTTATNKTTAMPCDGKAGRQAPTQTCLLRQTHSTAGHSPHSRCNAAPMPSPFPSRLHGRTEQFTCSPPRSCLHTRHPHHPCTACSLPRADQQSLLRQLSPLRQPADKPFLTALHTKQLEGRRGLKKLESKNSPGKSGEEC